MSALAALLAADLAGPDVVSSCVPLEVGSSPHGAPEERSLVADAAPRRRLEFLSGRALAHELLGRLGLDDGPILPGARGAPRWPSGVVGSISHCDTACAVLVGRAAAWSWLGVDLEEDEPLPPRVVPRVLRPEERRALASDPCPGRRSRLVFSAKECLYKALAPALDRVLAFSEVTLDLGPSIDPDRQGQGRFLARFADPAARPGGTPTALPGCWWAREGLLLTRIAVPRRGG